MWGDKHLIRPLAVCSFMNGRVLSALVKVSFYEWKQADLYCCLFVFWCVPGNSCLETSFNLQSFILTQHVVLNFLLWKWHEFKWVTVSNIDHFVTMQSSWHSHGCHLTPTTLPNPAADQQHPNPDGSSQWSSPGQFTQTHKKISSGIEWCGDDVFL